MRRDWRKRGLLAATAAVVATASLAAACSGGGDTNGWIAFRSPVELALIRPDGSDRRSALVGGPQDARHPDWSKDGARIALQADDPSGRTDIWIARSDGTQPRIVFDCVDSCGGSGDPAWSPDSKRLAYYAFTAAGGRAVDNEIRIMDVASRKVTAVVGTTGTRTLGAPRWAPDGHRLVVAVILWASLRLDDERIRGIGIGIIDLEKPHPSVRMITNFDSFSDYPDWHPSRDLIVFQAGATNAFKFEGRPANLFTIRPDGTHLTRLTSRGAAHPWIALPAWSPAGSKILVTLVHGLGNHTLATVDPDGTDLTDIIDSTTGRPVLGAHSRQAPESAG
jgi:Tol biopolymer transport system component